MSDKSSHNIKHSCALYKRKFQVIFTVASDKLVKSAAIRRLAIEDPASDSAVH